MQLFELGAEGGDQETDGELLAETEEMPYECGVRQKFPMLFDDPVPVQVRLSIPFTLLSLPLSRMCVWC